jgi:hypothetical protein
MAGSFSAGMASMLGSYLRKPQGWFEWAKRAASVVGWLVVISFVGHWIYLFDACRYGPPAENAVACLLLSFFSTYLAWLVLAIVALVKIVVAWL